jgi:hypothetical protein
MEIGNILWRLNVPMKISDHSLINLSKEFISFINDEINEQISKSNRFKIYISN